MHPSDEAESCLSRFPVLSRKYAGNLRAVLWQSERDQGGPPEGMSTYCRPSSMCVIGAAPQIREPVW